MGLKVAIRLVGDVAILDLSGALTIGDGSLQLREAVYAALESAKKKLLLNLKDVSGIDSSGLGELVSSYSTTNDQDGRLKLLHLPPKVEQLLMITKLITVFDTYDDEQKAIASFG